MRWVGIDIDMKTGYWTLPGQLNKSGRDHSVPLTSTMLDVVQGLPQTESEFMFPASGNPQNHFSGYSKAKGQLDRRSGVEG